MVVCPNCNHQNPEGSLQCENCYTPLPATTSCPNCGASVQTDATFCGQCGFNLQAETLSGSPSTFKSMPDSLEAFPQMPPVNIEPPQVTPTTASTPIASPWDEEESEAEDTAFSSSEENDFAVEDFGIGRDSTEVMNSSIKPEDFNISFEPEAQPETQYEPEPMPWSTTEPEVSSEVYPPAWEDSNDEFELPEVREEPEESEELMSFGEDEPTISTTKPITPPSPPSGSVPFSSVQPISAATQLQTQKATLLHVQTNTTLEIAQNLDVIHIGKPNSQIPPDIDVAGFPDSEVVSRIHADIRVEGDAYFIEDVGSSNGTYINHTPLVKGNRHRLRGGDRIALGKGDLVTFIFHID
jgi:pSer/pThr/pTyr-binding forkhead associated (FHA) protein